MMATSSFIWASASRTDVGIVRELNEDACLEATAKGLWAVADGMGGHAVGDVASQMVVDTLAETAVPSSLGAFVEDVRTRLQDANTRLRQEAIARGAGLIGCTVAVLLTYGRHCVYLWAGDSRIYLYRNAQLEQLSRDHSQVEELVARGLLDRSQVGNHPSSNAITRAVGAADRLDLDDQMLEVKDGDVFLICTDGLTNEVTSEEIAAQLVPGNCRRAADNLISLALRRGARDNVTVVVLRADDRSASDKTIINPTPFDADLTQS